MYPLAPVWRAAGAASDGIGNVTPGLPAGLAADDIMLLCVSGDEAATLSTPSGWNLITSTANSAGTTSSTIAMYWRRATASESGPTYTDTGDHTVAIIHAVSGCIGGGTPYDSTCTTVASDNTTGTSIWFNANFTTKYHQSMVFMFAGIGVDTTTNQFTSWTNWPAYTDLQLRSETESSQGAGSGMLIGTGIKDTAGLVSNPAEVFYTTTSFRNRISIALIPAFPQADINVPDSYGTSAANQRASRW